MKKNILFAVGCAVLAVMLTLSTYITLVVFGVVTEENKNGEHANGDGAGYIVNVDGNAQEGDLPQGGDGLNNYSPNFVPNGNVQNPQQNNQGGGSNVTDAPTPGAPLEKPDNNITAPSKSDYYLNTQKSAKEVIDIYADIMNKTKAAKPGYTKVEYQDLPGDANNRVVTEGAESIEKVFGFIETLGLIVDEKTAREEPFIHEKGEEMSKFPVFDREKGSYLTDPKGVKSYTYTADKNGNVKLTFTLINEKNPEPIGENSSVAPSYTGAVFSPMSKAKIDNTVNHPIVMAFAKNIKYSLTYHDCKVEMVFNPETEEIVSLNHYAYINLSGSGDVIGGRMALQKQELVTVVLINDFKY